MEMIDIAKVIIEFSKKTKIRQDNKIVEDN